MKLRCIVVDDEPMARQLLLDFSAKVDFVEIEANFSNAIDALQFLKHNTVDLVFLDIQMPDLTGLELLEILQPRPQIIFTTAYAEYAVDGFNLDATDYLLKPFDFPRFLKAVNKAQNVREPAPVESSVKEFLFVKDGRELVKLPFDEIQYIKGMKDYVSFHTKEKRVTSLMNLKDLEQTLPDGKFLRIHQSYIINTESIESISRDKVKIGEEFLPVSQSYRNAFKNFVDQRLGGN